MTGELPLAAGVQAVAVVLEDVMKCEKQQDCHENSLLQASRDKKRFYPLLVRDQKHFP